MSRSWSRDRVRSWSRDRVRSWSWVYPFFFIPGSSISFYNSSWSMNKQGFEFVSRVNTAMWVVFSKSFLFFLSKFIYTSSSRTNELSEIII